ncbi:MAG: hypothetical protein JRI25_25755 [Deltaproteobacteria bacterium]|nr:hypothetical protein [Deltaproteobacteria bacterium]MBW2257986.1 hypothetical protein [Deltaproteobacteria bacterium]
MTRAFVLLTLALGACAPLDDSETGDTSDSETLVVCGEVGTVCATLLVPSDYAGIPVSVAVAFYDVLPPVGPPTVIVGTVEDPEIGVAEPLDLEMNGMEDEEGQLLPYVALFNEGGGTYMPVPGVDYIWEGTEAVDVGGGVELGELTLELLLD